MRENTPSGMGRYFSTNPMSLRTRNANLKYRNIAVFEMHKPLLAPRSMIVHAFGFLLRRETTNSVRRKTGLEHSPRRPYQSSMCVQYSSPILRISKRPHPVPIYNRKDNVFNVEIRRGGKMAVNDRVRYLRRGRPSDRAGCRWLQYSTKAVSSCEYS